MAQRIQVLYVDDIDGSAADRTVRFGVGGTEYEIDLSSQHADQFAAELSPFIAAARRVTPSRRPARASRAGRRDQSAVRDWARGQGIKISERGRIPAEVLDQYNAAH
jgi:nucleoid-associated protein Lsr2